MILRTLLLLLAACIPLTAAQATPQFNGDADLQRLSNVPDPQARIEQMDKASLDLFHQALREYDVEIERAPYDIMAQLARCQFIADFADANEYAAFVDDVYQESSACSDQVELKFPQHPEVQLQQLDRVSPDKKLKAAEATLARIQVESWTHGQLSRLLVLLAEEADRKGDQRSIEYARRALGYDQRADVRELLGRRLIAAGKKSEAIEVLIRPADPHETDESWYYADKLRLLGQAGASREVLLSVHKTLQGRQGYDHLQIARILMRAGAVDEARLELESSGAEKLPAALWERFRFEFDHGNSQAALEAYNNWRNAGWINDPLGVNRIALLSKDLGLPWKARDLLGLAGLLLTIVATGGLILVPISMVHYRGLARRAHTMDSYPRSGWQLRHAWLALLLFAAAQVFALYGAGPFDLRALSQPTRDLSMEPAQLARIAILSAMIGIVLLLPLSAMAKRMWSRWAVRYWSVGRALLVGCFVGVVLRTPLLYALMTSPGPIESGATQDALWVMLKALRDEFGIVSALWVVGVFAPVIEEFIFRGVMLNAMASHIRFRWANVIQALLFTAMHTDIKAAVPLFIFGLVSAVLAKRSGGLLASMAMHSAFNLIGTTAVLLGR